MRFVKESFIQASCQSVFAFHERPDALDLLMPPWESARVIQRAKISEIGSRAVLETKIFGLIKIRWVAEHTAYNSPHSFEDIQVQGPFRSWRHRHVIEARDQGSLLRDEITYEPPLSLLGQILAPVLVEPRLRRLFDYRHRITQEWWEKGRHDVGVYE